MSSTLKFDSIGLAGYAVGVLQINASNLRWSPRHADDAPTKDVELDSVMRAAWTAVGKTCHVRFYCKNGDKLRFDGFRRNDIDTQLAQFFDANDIDFGKEEVASGGGNYGTLVIDDDTGVLSLTRDDKRIFEVDLTSVSQCMTPGNKNDELDVHFLDTDAPNRDDQTVYSMGLYVPGKEAADYKEKVLSRSDASESKGDVIVEFDREEATFVAPKNRYTVEMYDTFLRMTNNQYEHKIKYSDINRYYMLQKPTGSRGASGVNFFYFVICLEKPVRQGKKKFPFLVWQTQNEDTEVEVKLEEKDIEARYPGKGIKPVMAGALHILIGKLFKVLTGKTVFAGSKKFQSKDGNQCIDCNLGQMNGVLYPNDKSFVYLHQTNIGVIEYSDVEYVEFVKAPGHQTRNFEFLVQKKGFGGENGKMFKFGGVEKKEFKALQDFMLAKENFFKIRNYVAEEEEEEEEDDEDDEEDEDFNSDVPSEKSSTDSDDSDLEPEDDDDGDDESAGPRAKAARSPTTKKQKVEVKASPQKKKKGAKKDPNAPKRGMSAFMLWSNHMRPKIKAESPDLKLTEISKVLGEKWKEVGEETKKEWQVKADTDKARYLEEMKTYVAPDADSDDDDGGKPKKKRKAPKDPNAPKKPMTSYFFYMAQERGNIKAANPGASIGELGKLMGAKWKEMSEEDKRPFNEQATAAKEKYQVDLASYTAGKSGADDEEPSAKKSKVPEEDADMDAADGDAEDGGAGGDDDDDDDDDME